MPSFEEAVSAWNKGLISGYELWGCTMAGLRLSNVHARMAHDPARRMMEGTSVGFQWSDRPLPALRGAAPTPASST